MIFLILGISGIPVFSEDVPPASAPADSQQVDPYEENQRQLMKKFYDDKALLNFKLSKELAKLGESAEDDQKRRELIQDNQKQLDALRDQFVQSLRELQREERKVRYGREELERPIFQYDQETLNYYHSQELRKKSAQNRESLRKQVPSSPSNFNQQVNPYQQPQQNFASQPMPAQQSSAADQWMLEKLTNQAAAEKAQLPPAGALSQPMSKTIKSMSQDPHRATPNSSQYPQNKAR